MSTIDDEVRALYRLPLAEFTPGRQALLKRGYVLATLLTDVLARSCLSCSIDAEPRKSERPSDHAPVVAEFAI